jgi:hypothetical protein
MNDNISISPTGVYNNHEWSDILKNFELTDKSKIGFCKNYNITRDQLNYRRNKEIIKSQISKPSKHFTKVNIVPSKASKININHEVTIISPDGYKVLIPENFNQSSIIEILQIIKKVNNIHA